MSGLLKVLAWHPTTETGSSDPHWGEEEQTVSAPVPLMTGTVPSQSPTILAFEGNPASYVQANGRSNMSSVLID